MSGSCVVGAGSIQRSRDIEKSRRCECQLRGQTQEAAESACCISSYGSAPTALAMLMYSATSSRRSPFSYFDTKVWRCPMRSASCTWVTPASLRAWMSAVSRAW